ncbi:hypothetical protein M8J76_010982 [Diaphorina citri]|nr:hypothetical protein M8J75_004613 [Diaphorina citri]KAI5723786.1 hypothetical protein M8J76_010982 [Diaphorina citri]
MKLTIFLHLVIFSLFIKPQLCREHVHSEKEGQLSFLKRALLSYLSDAKHEDDTQNNIHVVKISKPKHFETANKHEQPAEEDKKFNKRNKASFNKRTWRHNVQDSMKPEDNGQKTKSLGRKMDRNWGYGPDTKVVYIPVYTCTEPPPVQPIIVPQPRPVQPIDFSESGCIGNSCEFIPDDDCSLENGCPGYKRQKIIQDECSLENGCEGVGEISESWDDRESRKDDCSLENGCPGYNRQEIIQYECSLENGCEGVREITGSWDDRRDRRTRKDECSLENGCKGV